MKSIRAHEGIEPRPLTTSEANVHAIAVVLQGFDRIVEPVVDRALLRLRIQ